MDPFRPDRALAERAVALTSGIVSDCGARLAGSRASRKAAGLLEGELAACCDRVSVEEFSIHPDSFLAFMKFYAATYVASLVFFVLGGFFIHAAAILLLTGTMMSLSQFVFYLEFFDPFFKRRSGFNVVGVIEPAGEVRRQVLVSGHHDSAREFKFLASRWQKLYAPRITAGVLCYLALTAAALAWALFRLQTGADPGFSRWMLPLGLAGAVFVVPFYFFLGEQGTPGAGDNMIGSVMAASLAGIFGRAKKDGAPLLAHTRIVAASFDAEECGLRGARDFVKRHAAELAAAPVSVLNIDSIYELDELKFLTSDLNGFTPLSRRMAGLCRDTAEALGRKATLNPMVFGGGATDAAEFAKKGIEATSLLAMSTKHVRENLVYHTLADTADRIEPEAVLAGLDIAYHFILLTDRSVADR